MENGTTGQGGENRPGEGAPPAYSQCLSRTDLEDMPGIAAHKVSLCHQGILASRQQRVIAWY